MCGSNLCVANLTKNALSAEVHSAAILFYLIDGLAFVAFDYYLTLLRNVAAKRPDGLASSQHLQEDVIRAYIRAMMYQHNSHFLF